MAVAQELEGRALARQWFYKFRMPSGKVTDTYVTDDILKIHDTRERMLIQVLEREFGATMRQLSCVDLACHQGFFSHTFASRGFKEVVGVDARAEHLADATLMRDIFGYKNLRFMKGDLQTLTPAEVGRVLSVQRRAARPHESGRVGHTTFSEFRLLRLNSAAR